MIFLKTKMTSCPSSTTKKFHVRIHRPKRLQKGVRETDILLTMSMKGDRYKCNYREGLRKYLLST